MPVTLVVRRRGEADLAPVSFDGPRVVIGRGASCDLRVPDASVSSRHASIRANGAQWVVVDEGSTNGTKLNGEKLAVQAPRALKTGDQLILGRIELSVKLGAAPPSTQEQTREIALALVARSLSKNESDGSVAASPVRARVEVREGVDHGAAIELETAPKSIGRDPRCALRLTDRGVPPVALDVVLEGSRVRVTQRDPRADARLGERTFESSIWTDGTVLTLASTKLVLTDPVARALDQSAHGEDEKLSAAPAAPEPAPLPPPEPEVAADVAPAEPPPPEPKKPERPAYDRRKSWRGATLAFEIIALVLALAVLAGSIAGLWWLLRK